MAPLNTLKTGTDGVIVRNLAPEPLKSRLLSLGFIKGMRVAVKAHSFGQATMIIKLNEASNYSMRQSEAAHILVRPGSRGQ